MNSYIHDSYTSTSVLGQLTSILNSINTQFNVTLSSVQSALLAGQQVYQQLIGSAEADAQTITLTTSGHYVVSIYASSTADTTFKVDYSNDNTNWYNYYTTASTAGELLHIETTNAGVLYVRLSSAAAGGTADTVTLVLSSK